MSSNVALTRVKVDATDESSNISCAMITFVEFERTPLFFFHKIAGTGRPRNAHVNPYVFPVIKSVSSGLSVIVGGAVLVQTEI